MNRIMCFAFLSLVTCSLVLGQSETDKAKLLGSFGANDDDILNAVYLLGESLSTASFDPQEDSLAIRVCSNEPLFVALAMAKSAPFMTTLKLEKRGIPKSSVFFLRQNKRCESLPNKYASTEFWLVRKNAEFPEFVESRRASQLFGDELTHAGYLSDKEPFEVRSHKLEELTPQSYKMVLIKLVKSLKRSKSAVAVIQVPYYKTSSTTELNDTVRDTLSYLRGNNVASYRVYVRRIYSGISVPAFLDKPKYPDVLVIGEN